MSRFVDAARRWIGTPYVHGASTCGGGTDCLGLIRGVWRECLGYEPEDIPAYTADWLEPQRDDALLAAASRIMVQIPVDREMVPGQVLLFRMRAGAVAKHLAILSAVQPVPKIIHAYSGRSVVETSLSAPWARRVAARFDFPTED
ncbi:peptidase [Jannaschia aquimarina]|uniref:NlpC/P60 domain-containing protein n=1 Tax=Jannaschia aquimarina TaxID=935700 RepID=A0A0D1CRA0_9RHOB|nr:peptidase [Jannaschia aquimarina]KIT17297.1 hypothetical protein jaqu_10280 [Jannaschia aquimarina]SNT19842.1 putative phage cell wall peptidase, NlpC/P60 family [Jannaschia aquimarina]